MRSETLVSAWNRLPPPSRTLLRRSGIPYVGSYLVSYRTRTSAERFCGALPAIRAAYERGTGAAREAAARRFDAVMDSLVLPNGVRKTTHARRLDHALRAFLAHPRRPPDGSALRVLDLPCSSGIASLDTRTMLAGAYRIDRYVIADVCMEVRLDPATGCVYDTEGTLLQVRTRRGFFPLFRPHAGGEAFSPLSALALLPFAARAAAARRRHPAPDAARLVPLHLLHPAAEAAVERGEFIPRALDVFDLGIEGEFDLAVSFNLLQKNYFPPARIRRGLDQLSRALVEGGFLLWGNSESFAIVQKREGRLETVHQHGNW